MIYIADHSITIISTVVTNSSYRVDTFWTSLLITIGLMSIPFILMILVTVIFKVNWDDDSGGVL